MGSIPDKEEAVTVEYDGFRRFKSSQAIKSRACAVKLFSHLI